MEAHVTTIFGHEYSIDPLPPREGQRVMFRVMALLGPSFATLIESLLGSRAIVEGVGSVVFAKTPEDRARAIAGLASVDVPEGLVSAEDWQAFAASVMDGDVAKALPGLVAGLKLGGVGETLSEAVRRLAMEDAELIEALLGTATRDGKPLKNPAHYAEAFTANYWELAAAVYAVLDANGLFRLPST